MPPIVWIGLNKLRNKPILNSLHKVLTRVLFILPKKLQDDDAPPPMTLKEIEDAERAEKQAQQRKVNNAARVTFG